MLSFFVIPFIRTSANTVNAILASDNLGSKAMSSLFLPNPSVIGECYDGAYGTR